MSKVTALLSLLFVVAVFLATLVQGRDLDADSRTQSVAELRRELKRFGGGQGWHPHHGEQEEDGMMRHNSTFGGDNGRDHPGRNETSRWGEDSTSMEGNGGHHHYGRDGSDSSSEDSVEDTPTLMLTSALQDQDEKNEQDQGLSAGAKDIVLFVGLSALVLLGLYKLACSSCCCKKEPKSAVAVAVPVDEEMTSKPHDDDLEAGDTSSESSD